MKNVTYLFCLLLISLLFGCGSEKSSEQPIPNSSNSDGVQGTPFSKQVYSFSYKRMVKGNAFRKSRLVSEDFMNAKAQINTPQRGDTIRGNITVTAEQIEDEEGIKKIWLGFSQSDKAFLICSENCTSPYQLFETGINPHNFNQSPGSIQLQIWVEDLQGNVSLAQSQQINWLPEKVIMRESIREDDSVTLNWLASSSILRYNAYLSESPIDELADFILTKPNQRMISITNNSHVFENLSARKNYYARVTGIDGSGESAFSENILISAQEVIFPIAVNDEFQIEQFESLSGNLLANDKNNGLSPIILELTPVIAPEYGELTLFENGDFTYTPQNNFSGMDSFKYRIINPQGLTSEAIVTITIKQINTAPAALFNEFLVSANSEFRNTSNALILNDIDFDGGQLSINTLPVKDVEHGTLILDNSGSFSYTPEEGFIGEDTFIYQLQDGQGGEDTGEVKLTVVEEVIQPVHVSVNDDYLLNEDEVLIIDAPGILVNDIGENLQSYNLTISQITMNGVLELSPSGSFRYFPDENFYGSDYFIYEVENAEGVTTSAFVLLKINAVNDAPVTQDDDISVSQNQSIAIAVLANDYDVDSEIDRASLQVVEQAKHGDVKLNLETGTIEYKSGVDFRGQDSFSYVVYDTEGGESNTSTVFIDVTGPNKSPIATNDSAETQQDTPIEISILGNDTDIDGTIDLNTVKLVTEPLNGTATFSVELSKIIYIPNSDFHGTDVLTYSFKDNEGASSNEATVTITVSRINKPPIAMDDSFDVDDGTTLELNILQNDSDTDGTINSSTLEILNTVQYGDLEVLSNGNVLYTNTDHSTALDSFTYRFKDNEDAFSNSATVTIEIIIHDTSPLTETDSATTFKNQSINLNVLSNDDFLGVPASESPVVIENQPSNGVVTIVNQNGEVSYTPTFNYIGYDTFSYRAVNSDGESSDPTSVSILVNNKNYPPVIEALTVDITTESNNGDVIAAIQASDPDDDEVSFELMGEYAMLFTISSSGLVSINDIETIMANGDAQYVVITKVCDQVEPPLCSESSLTVNVEQILPTEIVVVNTEYANSGIASVNLRSSFESHEVGEAIALADESMLITSGVGHYDELQGRNIHRAVITKITPFGEIDTSFANEGVFETDLGILVDGLPQNILGQNLAFDDINKLIYVSGYIDKGDSQDLFIMRLTESGQLDTSFANSGYYFEASESGDKASSVDLIIESNSLVALINIENGTLTESRLLRLNLDSYSVSHSLDIAVDIGSEAEGLEVLSETQYMVFGQTTNANNNLDIYLAKINIADLSLDNSFQNAGYMQLDLSNENVDNRIKSLVVLPDNKLMLTGDHLTVFGDYVTPDKYSLFLIKIDQTGDFDTAFNGTGYRVYDEEELPTLDEEDLLSFNAQGVDLKVASESVFVTINREIYSNNKAVQVIKVGLDSEIDLSWNSPNAGITAFDLDGVRSNGMLAVDAGYILYGQNHNNIGYNFYTSQWLAKVSLSGEFDSVYGYEGQSTINSSSSEEYVIGSSKQSNGDLLLAGHTLSWQNERVPYVYSIDYTGKENKSFGVLGLSLPNLISDANSTSITVNDDDSIFLIGNEGESTAFISKLTPSGLSDNLYAYGNNASFIYSSEFSAQSIEPIQIHQLETQEQLVLSNVFDGCINKSIGVYLSPLGENQSDFLFEPPAGYECLSNAFKLDKVHVEDTSTFGIGTDGQSYAAPRIVMVNVDSSGNLVSEFGEAGISTINVGTLQEQNLTVNGYLRELDGSFYIYGRSSIDNFIVKVNSLGEVDSSFATNGIFKFSDYSNDFVEIKKILFGSQNRLILFSQSSTSNGIYISRLLNGTDQGSIDTQLNEVGYQELSIDIDSELIDVQYHIDNSSFLFVLQDSLQKRIAVAAILITEQ
ncbi:Ig-like domain-containing protein [Pseudoalteromonas phenolica]|uniref:Ig-like domain-containing protein n=1 Tax=Pseudoalteromonas phenolica TaxID=161398 RepID=UPI00110A8560|nr:Ig-like domain-containing protein [Pseudoalteromonas phenolica]TMO56707.1 hypothetical protein CWC21_05915 [Pseudoalteromonas phenolica]